MDPKAPETSSLKVLSSAPEKSGTLPAIELMLERTIYGVAAATRAPDAATVIKGLDAILPGASMACEIIPCAMTGKAVDIRTCLLHFNPNYKYTTTFIQAVLMKNYKLWKWYLSGQYLIQRDEEAVRKAAALWLQESGQLEPSGVAHEDEIPAPKLLTPSFGAPASTSPPVASEVSWILTESESSDVGSNSRPASPADPVASRPPPRARSLAIVADAKARREFLKNTAQETLPAAKRGFHNIYAAHEKGKKVQKLFKKQPVFKPGNTLSVIEVAKALSAVRSLIQLEAISNAYLEDAKTDAREVATKLGPVYLEGRAWIHAWDTGANPLQIRLGPSGTAIAEPSESIGSGADSTVTDNGEGTSAKTSMTEEEPVAVPDNANV